MGTDRVDCRLPEPTRNIIRPKLGKSDFVVQAVRILETALYAEDLDACLPFYRDVLGLEVISFDPQRSLFLRLADSVLIVFKASRTIIADSEVPPHGTTGSGHAAFSASAEELETWRQRLAGHGVEIIKEIEWRNGAKSIYFNDPAGNVLEFATPNLWFAT